MSEPAKEILDGTWTFPKIVPSDDRLQNTRQHHELTKPPGTSIRLTADTA